MEKRKCVKTPETVNTGATGTQSDASPPDFKPSSYSGQERCESYSQLLWTTILRKDQSERQTKFGEIQMFYRQANQTTNTQ